jgi:hypothetical protein
MRCKDFWTGSDLSEDNNPTSCILVLLITIGAMVEVVPVGCLYLSFYIQEGGGGGYKKGNRVGYNMIKIRILSLLAYFTYIFIDIIFYALGSMSWSFGIF